jgi:hypothetical protein
MALLGKVHRMTIYPPFGHAFVYQAAPTWEADVFAFLSEHMERVQRLGVAEPPPPAHFPCTVVLWRQLDDYLERCLGVR